jgi:tubulin--tyrosine ligase
VLAVSDITVYVYKEVLILCSASRYNWRDTSDLASHITNTCYQHEMQQQLRVDFDESKYVLTWEDFQVKLIQDGTVRNEAEACSITLKVLNDIYLITRDLFAAYVGQYSVFTPLHGCFEHYGLDFLVDEKFNVYLLEVNPGPDFRQTGKGLSNFIIGGLMSDTIDIALRGIDGNTDARNGSNNICKMKKVFSRQLRGSKN